MFGRYWISIPAAIVWALSSGSSNLTVDLIYLSSIGFSNSKPDSLIFSLKNSTCLFISVKATSFLVSYSVNYFWADSFNESADSTRLSLSPSSANLGRIVLRASLGSFLALTVLMRSGRSSDLSFFMVWMKFLCWTSLKIVKALLSSSMVLTTSELDLVNLSQST